MSGETTESMREGLTKRGIEWRSGLEGVTFVGDWCFVEYDNGRLAATCEPVLTSEQAIAATLGNLEIVRCRDCKRYIEANSLTGWNDICDLTDSNVQPNGFCAWAERKEVDE